MDGGGQPPNSSQVQAPAALVNRPEPRVMLPSVGHTLCSDYQPSYHQKSDNLALQKALCARVVFWKEKLPLVNSDIGPTCNLPVL